MRSHVVLVALLWTSSTMGNWIEVNLAEDDVGEWRVVREDGKLKILVSKKSRALATIELPSKETTQGDKRLELASVEKLEGHSGAFRVKTLCGEKMVWLSWTERKLDYVNRYTKREGTMIELICRVIDGDEDKSVVDLGANHGLYLLLAAKKGAHVRGVEAQGDLASLLVAAAEVNGLGERIEIFHNAILDVDSLNPNSTSVEVPEMARHHTSEGGTAAIGRVVRNVVSTNVSTIPVSSMCCWDDKAIAFLKVDVEGVELAALRSALPLFRRRLVKHAVVEFGPTARWASLSQNTGLHGLDVHAARTVLRSIRDFGYRTTIGGHGLCIGVHPPAPCRTFPPHVNPLADVTLENQLAAILAKNAELSLYLDLLPSESSSETHASPGGNAPLHVPVVDGRHRRRRRRQ